MTDKAEELNAVFKKLYPKDQSNTDNYKKLVEKLVFLSNSKSGNYLGKKQPMKGEFNWSVWP